MPRFKILFYSVILTLVVFYGCKEESVNPPVLCTQPTFQVNHLFKFWPVDMVEDGNGCTYILGNALDTVIVLKLDPHGALMWRKSYPQVQGKAQSIISLSDNSIVFASAFTDTVNLTSIYFHNVWIKSGFIVTYDNTCERDYVLGDAEVNWKNTGKSLATRISPDGALIWTKEFEGGYCGGEMLSTNDAGNILLMAFRYTGMIAEPVYDTNGTFMDTVYYYKDKNKVSLYCLDTSGQMVWSNTYNDIFCLDYSLSYDRFLTTTNNFIAITLDNGILVIDKQGVEYARINPVSPYCRNLVYQICRADNDLLYVTGQYFHYDQNHQGIYTWYFAKINKDGQTIWEKPLSGKLAYLTDETYVFQNGVYDKNGNLLWTANYLNSGTGFLLTPNCLGGVVCARYKAFYDWTITKSNNNGTF